MSTRDVGSSAEDLAARHLQHLGWRILDRNYRIRRGELDLVALEGETLSFVEVRARKDARFGAPEETVGAVKQSRLVRAAQHWLASRGGSHAHRPCRFDVIGIEGGRLRLIKDAFRL